MGTRVPGAEKHAQALGWPVPSPPGPKSDGIGLDLDSGARMSPVGGKADLDFGWLDVCL